MHLLLAETQANVFDCYQATFCRRRVEEVKILLESKRTACPVRQLLKCAGSSRFKHFILSTPLSLCLIRNMSVPSSDDLKDYTCERRKITQRPPIAYAQYKYKPWLTEANKIKIKLLEGDTFTCSLMGDSSNAKTYMKWYFVYLWVISKKIFNEKLLACARGP